MGTPSKTLIRLGAGAILCLLALLWLVPSNANPGGSPADRSFSQEIAGNPVTLSVTAIDSQGNPVQDLEKGDFSLLEDGKPQEILQFAQGASPISLTLAVERSLFNWVPDRPLLAIQGFLDRIGSRGGIALIVFDR